MFSRTRNSRAALLALLVFVVAIPVKAADRIISTDGFVTELLFSLGAQNQLIAIDVTSSLPEGHKELPNIGYHRNLSAEGILSLKPNLIIGSEHMGPEHAVSAIKKTGIQLIQLKSAQTPIELKNNIFTVAKALELEEHAIQITRRLDEKLNQLDHRQLETHTFAFLLSMDPHKLRLAGTGTNGHSLIKLLGGENVGTFKNYQSVSAESLLALDPDVILVAARDQKSAVAELLKNQSSLRFSKAAKNEKIVAIQGRSIIAGISPAAVDEALRIADLLIPSVASQE